MDAVDDWDRKMRALKRLQLLYSQSGGKGLSGGGPPAPPVNPLQDESFIPITTEIAEFIFV